MLHLAQTTGEKKIFQYFYLDCLMFNLNLISSLSFFFQIYNLFEHLNLDLDLDLDLELNLLMQMSGVELFKPIWTQNPQGHNPLFMAGTENEGKAFMGSKYG